MIYYLKTIFLIFIYFTIITKIMLTLFLIYGIWYLRYYLSKYIVTLKELRIIYMEFYILNTILFFLFYICLLGYWRFLNTDRTLDLNFYIYHNYTFLKDITKFEIQKILPR